MMLHPASAHFAIVLPAIAVVFGIVYLYTRSEGMSKISSRLTLFAALGMIISSYTGYQAGPEILEYLSREGRNSMIDHRNMGLALTGALIFIAALKLLGCKLKKFTLEAIAVVLLVGVSILGFAQGKSGGELVYNHGMPFSNHLIMDSIKETLQGVKEAEDDETLIEVYEDGLDDIITYSEDVNNFYGNEPRLSEDEDE